MAPQVQLTAFEVTDFKSFRSARLQLAPLTVLIGPNASGKSNLLEAMRLSKWLASGIRLDQLGASLAHPPLAVRGTPTELPRDRSAAFGLGWRFDSGAVYDRHSVTIAPSGPGARVAAEHLAQPDGRTLYELTVQSVDDEHAVEVTYDRFGASDGDPRVVCRDQQLVLTQLTSPARLDAAHGLARTKIPAIVARLLLALDRLHYLDPQPSAMRGYVPFVDHELRFDGSNVSAVLRRLAEDVGWKDKLLTFVADLPEDPIADLDFIETPRHEVMVQLVENFASQSATRDAPLLSDGTLRVLAIAAAVYSIPERSILVIEEIDNGIHPSRAGALMERLDQIAHERNLRLIISTHNPALMDAVPTRAVPDVTVCYRDPDDGTSCLARLGDLERFPSLMAQGTLGWLSSSRRLEKALRDPTTSDDRLDASLRWLASLDEPAA